MPRKDCIGKVVKWNCCLSEGCGKISAALTSLDDNADMHR